MNLFSRMLSYFGKGATSNPDQGAQNASSGGIATDAGITVTDERAMQVSSVWACTQYIVNSVCSLPLNFYEKNGNNRIELDERHYLNELFHTRPNAFMKPRDFRKAMTFQLCMWSNAYAEIFWNEAGTRPLAIVPLRAGRMTPHIVGGELVYHYQTSEGVRVYARKSIFHLKGFGSDGIVGFDRADYARKTLGISVSADVYASKQFANGGNTGTGHLSFDKFLKDDQREQARKMYVGFAESAYNKGQPRILEGGIKWNAEGLNPDTMQMIETRKMQVSEIARFFGVPEVLVGGGESSSSWPASFEQQLLSFLTFTLQDYIDEWETEIKESLIPRSDKKTYADHDVSEFIKMDSEAKAAYHSTLVQNGLETRNEGRKKLNLEEKDGGNELTVQVNLTPIEQMMKLSAANEPKI